MFNNAKIVLTDKNLLFYYVSNRIPQKSFWRKCGRIVPNIKGTDKLPYPLSSLGINTPSGSVLRLCQIQPCNFRIESGFYSGKKKSLP